MPYTDSPAATFLKSIAPPVPNSVSICNGYHSERICMGTRGTRKDLGRRYFICFASLRCIDRRYVTDRLPEAVVADLWHQLEDFKSERQAQRAAVKSGGKKRKRSMSPYPTPSSSMAPPAGNHNAKRIKTSQSTSSFSDAHAIPSSSQTVVDNSDIIDLTSDKDVSNYSSIPGGKYPTVGIPRDVIEIFSDDEVVTVKKAKVDAKGKGRQVTSRDVIVIDD